MTETPADLLEIPPYLRRGTRENEDFMRRGAELLAQEKAEGTAKQRTPPDPRSQDPTKAQISALAKLGWKWHHVLRISRADADAYLEAKLGPECRFPPSKEARWGSAKDESET